MANTLQIQRLPRTDEELWEFVATIWGIEIPRSQVCEHHTPPFTAFANAFFARDPVAIWKASRGFGGKSRTLSILTLTEAVVLGAQVTLLGGSSAQSLNVHEASKEAWDHPLSPSHMLRAEPTMYMTRFKNGAWIKALTASQRSARGPHPQRLRLDEIDEMDLAILEAAQGQPMDDNRNGVLVTAQTVMSSTHQYPDKTMSAMLERASEKGWPVYEWCWRENLEPWGWLTRSMVRNKRIEISNAMWAMEYDMQEPSFEGRAIDGDALEEYFTETLGVCQGAYDQIYIFEKPVVKARYVTGVDWAQTRDWTVIDTFRTDVTPWRRVAWQRTGRKPWPLMIANLRARLEMYPGTCAHDATGLGNVVKDLIDAKVPVQDVVLGGSVRSSLFSDYVAAIESRAFRSPKIDFCYGEHKYLTSDDLYGKGHPADSFVAGALCWLQRKGHVPTAIPVADGLTRPSSPWSV